MNATLTHDCPKCSSVGRLASFAHIHNGVCFLCNGEKMVTERTAARWLANEVGGRGVVQGSQTVRAPAKPSKKIELGDFGTIEISRHGDKFWARNLRARNESGVDHYFLVFRVTNGRVQVDQSMLQYGMAAHWRRAEQLLQAALRR